MGVITLFDNLEKLIFSDITGVSELTLQLRILYGMLAVLYVVVCFYGDKLQDIMMGVTSVLFGIFLSLLLGALFHSNIVSFLGILPLGVIFGFVGYKIKRIGQGIFVGFIPSIILAIMINIIAGIGAFIVLFIIGLILSKLSITAIISLSSGVASAQLITMTFGINQSWIVVAILGCILAIAGFLVQCISMAKAIRNNREIK